MNAKEFAKRLDGNIRRHEMSREDIELAMEHDLVVIFGASDDLLELRGIIDDEVEAYEGVTIYVNRNCDISMKSKPGFAKIQAIWCDGNEAKENVEWTYKTSIPHTTFNIQDDDNPENTFCRGIVFSLDDI